MVRHLKRAICVSSAQHHGAYSILYCGIIMRPGGRIPIASFSFLFLSAALLSDQAVKSYHPAVRPETIYSLIPALAMDERCC